MFNGIFGFLGVNQRGQVNGDSSRVEVGVSPRRRSEEVVEEGHPIDLLLRSSSCDILCHILKFLPAMEMRRVCQQFKWVVEHVSVETGGGVLCHPENFLVKLGSVKQLLVGEDAQIAFAIGNGLKLKLDLTSLSMGGTLSYGCIMYADDVEYVSHMLDEKYLCFGNVEFIDVGGDLDDLISIQTSCLSELLKKILANLDLLPNLRTIIHSGIKYVDEKVLSELLAEGVVVKKREAL